MNINKLIFNEKVQDLTTSLGDLLDQQKAYKPSNTIAATPASKGPARDRRPRAGASPQKSTPPKVSTPKPVSSKIPRIGAKHLQIGQGGLTAQAQLQAALRRERGNQKTQALMPSFWTKLPMWKKLGIGAGALGTLGAGAGVYQGYKGTKAIGRAGLNLSNQALQGAGKSVDSTIDYLTPDSIKYAPPSPRSFLTNVTSTNPFMQPDQYSLQLKQASYVPSSSTVSNLIPNLAGITGGVQTANFAKNQLQTPAIINGGLGLLAGVATRNATRNLIGRATAQPGIGYGRSVYSMARK